MRIAIIDLIFVWPPDGGARTEVREIAVRWARDHEVKLFHPVFLTPGAKECITADPGIELEPVIFSRYRHFNFWHAPRIIRKTVEKWKPDRIFIADGRYMKPYVVSAFKDMKPVLKLYAHEGICLNRHGLFFRDDEICKKSFLNGGLFDMLTCQVCAWQNGPTYIRDEIIASLAFSPIYKRVAEMAFRDAYKILVYNGGIRNMLIDLNPNTEVVPPGVDEKLFTPDMKESRGEKTRILMVGRASVPIKGFKTLEEACNILHNDGLNFKLILTDGDVEINPLYMERTPWLTQAELPALYRKADICVVPSAWPEPFGIVALEAMSCAKPLVVSKIGGLGEIFEGEECGYKVPPGDAGALAEKLKLLILDPELRRKMGERGRELILEKYSWDNIYEKYYRNMFD